MTDEAPPTAPVARISCPHCRHEISVRLEVSAVMPELARAVAREIVIQQRRGGPRLV